MRSTITGRLLQLQDKGQRHENNDSKRKDHISKNLTLDHLVSIELSKCTNSHVCHRSTLFHFYHPLSVNLLLERNNPSLTQLIVIMVLIGMCLFACVLPYPLQGNVTQFPFELVFCLLPLLVPICLWHCFHLERKQQSISYIIRKFSGVKKVSAK